jgi:hypothetical protein
MISRVLPSSLFPFGLLLTIVFAVVPASAQCNSNDTKEPCFSGNPDILGGQRSLLQDDDLVINIQDFEQPAGANLLTSDSSVSQQTANSVPRDSVWESNVLSLRGRLFNVNHDQTLSAVRILQFGKGSRNFASLEGSDASIAVPALSVLSVNTGGGELFGGAGDYLGNGFDQMVVMGSAGGQITLQAVAAVDPMNYSGGLKAGPASSPVANASSFYALAAGVFSDPQPGGPNLVPATLAVLSRSPGSNSGMVVTFYGVDSNLNITQTSALTLTPPSGTPSFVPTFAMAAGRFLGSGHDQLAVAFPTFPNGGTTGIAGILAFDFNQGSAGPQVYSSTSLPVSSQTASNTYSAAVYLANGRFNFSGTTDQVGISIGTDGQNKMAMGVMSFDSSLNGAAGGMYQASNTCHFSLAAGRFDSMLNGQPNPNLQLADVDLPACGGSGYFANIYDVTPNQTNANLFDVTLHSNNNIGNVLNNAFGPPAESGSLGVSLAATDEQGRSVMLGPPEKTTIAGHTQPDTVLGLPPMHVDWITPPAGTVPQILNVSVYPATFNAQYKFAQSSNSTVTRSATTSYTFSTKETSNESVSYGALGSSVSSSMSQAATQFHQSNIAKNFNTYSGIASSFDASTTFDDVVAATDSQLNVYTYPVLGQCTDGPAPADGCSPGAQLYVQFSGPDNVNYDQASEGRNLEWYQPVQEPGNIFSYPATVAQLTANLAGGNGFQPLTATNNTWDSETSSSTQAQWSSGSSSGASAGSTSTHSFDASVSASGKLSFAGASASAGVGFDYNQSTSMSTLNQSTTSFSNSQGITTNTGIGGGANGVYNYQGNSIIYGQTAPPGTTQTDATPNTTIQAQGFIAAAHLVDMVSQGGNTNSGNFWAQAYNAAPDLALNHPQRWQQQTPSGVNGQEVMFNCPYGYASTFSAPQCVPQTSGAPAPSAIADETFYEIKGLFITPGGTYTGPQITSTTLGSKVNLKLRVYNYSLANFPASATLHVQFYAQPWEVGQFTPSPSNSNDFAPAVFIGNGTTEAGGTPAPPPAFCGGVQSPGADPCAAEPGLSTNNWEYVYATWDTSLSVTANSAWKIWAVVWVENEGQLVAELPGHGLLSVPAENVQYNSLNDVPIELYSNNIGYFNQVFMVNAAATTLTSSSGSGTAKQLTIGRLTTRDNAAIRRNIPITLLVPHQAAGGDIDSVLAQYYDGDPARGGRLFDMQHIPRVALNSTYVDTASFQPSACGAHEIIVRSVPMDGSAAAVTAKKWFKVTSDPVVSIDDLIRYVRSPSYPRHSRQAMLAYLHEARRSFEKKDTRAGVVQMQVLQEVIRHDAFFLPEAVRKAIMDQISTLLDCV